MKSGRLFFMGVGGALFYFLVSIATAQYDGAYIGVSFISINVYQGSATKNAFTGSGSAMDASLYSLQLRHFPAYDTKTSSQNFYFTSIAFELSNLANMTLSSAGEMRLVRDMNGNEKPDPDDKIVSRSMIDFVQAAIFFKFDEPIGFKSTTLFFLVGDFPSLVLHAELHVKLSDRFIVIEDREEGRHMRVTVLGNRTTWHHEGNSPPILDYSSRLTDSKNGVVPFNGRSGDMFTFEVMYTDRDGDKAQRVELRIDLNENGIFEIHERFAMEVPDPPVIATSQRYRLSTRIISPRRGQMMYRFFASDGRDDAVGPATEFAYVRINNAFAITDARVLSDTMSDSVVPGEKFDIVYTVRYFFESVKVRWGSAPGLDVSPFTFLGAVHKNRHPLTLIYDEETLVVSFQAPSLLPEGSVRMPVISLEADWYDFDDKTEKRVHVFSPDVSVSVVPLRAWMKVIPARAAVTIADEIRVVLTIVKRPDVELISHPEHEFTFPLSNEGVRFLLGNEGNARVDKLMYTAVFHSTAAVGSAPRIRVITPLYKLEYRMPPDDMIRTIILPEQSLMFTPILTMAEVGGPALIFPRRAIASEFRFGTETMENMVTNAMYVLGGVAMSAILVPLVIYVWSMICNGMIYRRIVARSIWKSHVRLMKYAGRTVSPDLVIACEQSFRRYLSFVYGCSEAEAQSVALWKYMETPLKVSLINRISIRVSLERFCALSEGRASEDDAMNLIEAQYSLRKFI